MVYLGSNYKQLLDEVFVIHRVLKVEVRVTEILINWISQKANLKIVLLYIKRKKWKSCFCFFKDGKQHKAHELDMINTP